MPDHNPHKPGYNHINQLYAANARNVERMVDRLMDFINPKHWHGNLADIGPRNPKIDLLHVRANATIQQIMTEDFNWDTLHGQYNTVFCFEVLEHVQNPLWFMRQLRDLLAPDGRLYLTTPSNPHWLWYPFHFHEMNRQHLEKWILTPLDMHIVRHTRFNFANDWKAAFIGLRPLLRAIRDWDARPIIWSLVQINNFYEIHKDTLWKH